MSVIMVVGLFVIMVLPSMAQDDVLVKNDVGHLKSLKDYGIAGLDKKVELRSVDPWDIVQLIEFLAHRGGINNIVIGKGVSGKTTKLKFENVTVGEAMEVVLSVNKLAYVVKDNIITIITDEEYIQRYGVSFYDNKLVRIVELKYADPARVSNMLQPVKSTIGTVVSDPVTGTLIFIDTPDKIEQMLDIVRKTDIPTVSRIVPTDTETFKLQYADLDVVRDEISGMITKDIGSIHADRRTRSIIITDLPHNIEKIAEVIKAFDVREKQVFIEAKIVQVLLTDEFKLGINWDHVIQGIDPRFSLQSTVKTIAGPAAAAVPISQSVADVIGSSTYGALSYKTIVGGGSLEMVLAALSKIGDTKVLSNPHVAVVSDEEAMVKVITDQPYAEASLESGTTNVVGESIIFIEVGVKLSVTPHINDSGMIRMAIKPEVSTVVGTYQAFRNVPIVRKSYSETTVLIKDGETIIIAGMVEDKKTDHTSSVPLLGRIPLLGWLFKTKATQTQTLETIVFLTPRIISGEEPVMLLRDIKKQPKPLRRVGVGNKELKPIR
jgi:general secretion pathway protein D